MRVVEHSGAFLAHAAFSPQSARDIAGGMNAYLSGLPEPLYALFGTGYLGYTAARQWGKIAGSDIAPEYVEAKGAVKSTSGSTIDFRIEKAKAMLGWEPQVDLEAGLRRLIEWRKTCP